MKSFRQLLFMVPHAHVVALQLYADQRHILGFAINHVLQNPTDRMCEFRCGEPRSELMFSSLFLRVIRDRTSAATAS